MLGLIRPALCWVARIGLFLSVLAFLLSRFWLCQVHVPKITAKITEHGLVLSYRASLDKWGGSVTRASEHGWMFNDWLFGEDVELITIYSPFRIDGGPYRRTYPGFNTAYAYNSDHVL